LSYGRRVLPAAKAKFDQHLTRYPIKRAAIMPTLWLAQEEFGWLSHEAMEYVAGLLELPPAFVASVASFYTMYNKRRSAGTTCRCAPTSRAHCAAPTPSSIACAALGIGLGETTADGRFTLSEVECLGSCGTAPMMQVDDDFWENLTRRARSPSSTGWRGIRPRPASC
jgi:NADH-quinone oxidoreductase subunit E